MKGIRIIIQTLEEDGVDRRENPILAGYREISTTELLSQKVAIKTTLKIIADRLVDVFVDDIVLLGKFDDIVK